MSEISIGSVRFAALLGIKLRIEPSRKKIKVGVKREIDVVNGIAENLPYGDSKFDYLLMVTTLCFLSDVNTAFKEIYRVLKP